MSRLLKIEGLRERTDIYIYMFHNYETEKITRKASDASENLQNYNVLVGSSARDRHAGRI